MKCPIRVLKKKVIKIITIPEKNEDIVAKLCIISYYNCTNCETIKIGITIENYEKRICWDSNGEVTFYFVLLVYRLILEIFGRVVSGETGI